MAKPVSFKRLFQIIEGGNQKLFDESIYPSHLTNQCVVWAMSWGLSDPSQNVKRGAAMILQRSEERLRPQDLMWLEEFMQDEDASSEVQYLIAMALYKRGRRTPAVIVKMALAKNDRALGRLAKEVWEKGSPPPRPKLVR
ncbi:hypothetical protein A3D62_00665 [Candidatus Kaiserbacteria bacterium RIFCSPHIGHO2_02_FULL_49_11]|uniref:HEAT repeat domain-containing protein n=1 Tax=Candidatus Kaiserbacteria bacterium RIFCSPHIGHO2_02_FULL_49_11 TaxID=1798489 RepID=A0A1F6CZN3_9BACT|nr:MAG: hypothetical protein A3D62_00665 [Candidatus Kaiserbacteria bacterium RIFCSPHIGHO2_02_FULL_49_11]